MLGSWEDMFVHYTGVFGLFLVASVSGNGTVSSGGKGMGDDKGTLDTLTQVNR